MGHGRELEPIEVWYARADENLSRASDAYLIDSERSLADEVQVVRDQQRRRVRFALRRSVLALRVGVPPADIRYTVVQDGKPALPQGWPQFSASHADDDTLLAVSRHDPVGIDLEPSWEDGWEETARDILSPFEVEALADVPIADRASAYFAVWTRKEAALKALGRSIVETDPSEVVVTVPPTPPRLLRLGGDDIPAELWLDDVRVPSGLVSTLAAIGTRVPLLYRRWPLDLVRGVA